MDWKFIKLFRAEKLQSASIGDLREYLTARNLPNKGNKNFLLELVTEYLEGLGQW